MRTPIVLLHGVGLDHTMWGPFTRAAGHLTDRPVAAIDLPGHGGQPPLSRATTLAELAEDVLARIPDRSHLVGFSLGALIAQHVARFHPERAASLTSVSSVCRRTASEAAAVASRLEMGARDFPASVEASIERWYPNGSGVGPEWVEATRATLRANDVTSYLHAYRVFATGDADIGPELGNIRVPAFAVTGELDPGSTPEMTRRLGEAIPGSRTAVVPGARHMLPVQEADELARLVTGFIDESTGATNA
ncbi:alpha/beta fold hydrolase [Arthrobacter sp. JSM 101049]|uniref:alpha/beta fold hydrolase n=1 Tax=Arthrobacter sp. JSM 101049 TaxID=929097 RepID=UPI0035626BF7